MKSFPSTLFRVLFFGALGLSPLTASIVIIESTFDTDLDGWTKAPGSDSGTTLTWVSSGGNPDGFLRVNEAAQGNIDRIAAPAKFLGDMSFFIGGTFGMDRLTNTLSNPITSEDDIRLIGASLSLRFDLPSPGLNVWITETVDLTHDGGWVRVDNGLAPTPSDYATVMGNLQGIHLLADFRSGAETPSFDNIRMTGIPESASALLGLLGGLLLLRRGR